jgi:hypothetical protein
MSTVRIQVRRGTASQWTSVNPILAAGEMGVESDTNLFKFGNGSSTWTALAYANNSDVAIGEISQDAINTALSMGAGLTKSYNDGTNTIQITVDSTVVALKSYVDSAISASATAIENTADSTYLLAADLGQANGVASLNSSGKVPAGQLDIAEAVQDNIAGAIVAGSGVTKVYDDTLNTITLEVDTSTIASKSYVDSGISAESTTRQSGLNSAINAEVTARTSAIALAKSQAITTAGTYTDTAITNLVNGAPAVLDTLNELSAALGADANFATTVATNISTAVTTAASYTDTQVNIAVGNAQTVQTAHANKTTAVHGIADTSLLATTSDVATAKSEAIAAASTDATTKASAAQAAAISTAAAASAEAVSTAAATAAAATSTAAATAAADATTKANAAQAAAVVTAGTYTDTSIGAEVTARNSAITAAVSAETASRSSAISAAVATEVSNRDSAIASHEADTTNVHGIADTSALATTAHITTHNSDTTDVHGIADTSVLATATTVATAKSEAIAAAGTAADTKVSTAVAALTKSSVGLANVDNTADASKPVSTAQATAIATAKSEAIADATSQVNALLTGAPAALNTLDELAAALGDDANFASTVTTNLAAKAPLASPTFTGTVTVAAAGVAFTDGTQTKAGVPSITTIATEKSASETLAAGEQDKFIPLSGTVVITLPATGYSTGQSIDFWQSTGTGASFASTNGVIGTPGLKLRATNSVATAMKISSGWLVFGDLSA